MGQGGIHPPGDVVLMSTETSCHFGHLLLVSSHRRQQFLKIHCFTFFPYKSIRDQIWSCRKIGWGQPRVIIWTKLVAFEHPMLHTKFQSHQPFGSGEDFLRFLHIWAWRPSWSCDQDRLNKFSFPRPKEAPYEIGPVVSEEKMLENVDIHTTYIHTYGRRRPAYLISSPVSLQLRWAKNDPFAHISLYIQESQEHLSVI